MRKFFLSIVGMFCLLSISACNSVQSANEDVIQSRSDATLTRDEANAMVAELLDGHLYIDYDRDSALNTVMSPDRITPIQVKSKVAHYRFYDGMAKVNDRYVQTKDARELNISPRLYDAYIKELVEEANNILDDIDQRRKNGEEVNIYMADPTDKAAIEQVIRF